MLCFSMIGPRRPETSRISGAGIVCRATAGRARPNSKEMIKQKRLMGARDYR